MKRIDLTDFLGPGAYITYDPEADAVYLRLKDDSVHYTDTDAMSVNVDYSYTDSLIGVEIFL